MDCAQKLPGSTSAADSCGAEFEVELGDASAFFHPEVAVTCREIHRDSERIKFEACRHSPASGRTSPFH